MDALILSILLVFSLTLLVLGFFKKQVVIVLFSGISFMMLGLFLMNGIEYLSSKTTTIIDNTTTTINNTYTIWNHFIGTSTLTLNSTLGILFILFGLFLTLICGIALFTGKAKIDFTEDSED